MIENISIYASKHGNNKRLISSLVVTRTTRFSSMKTVPNNYHLIEYEVTKMNLPNT